MKPKLVIASLLLLASCTPRGRPSLESTFRDAKRLQREGNLPAALQLLEQQASVCANDPHSLAGYKLQLLKAELFQAVGRSAQAAILRDSSIPNSPDLSEAIAYQRMIQAGAIRNQPAEATRYLDEAEALAIQGGHRELLSLIERARGNQLISTNPTKAEESLRLSLRLAEETGDSALLASAHGSLGYFALKETRFDEAIGWFEKAASESASKSVQARTRQNLGWCYLQLGEFDQALAFFRQAARFSEEAGDVADHHNYIGSIGAALYEKGDLRAALPEFERALELAREHKKTSFIGIWLNNLATTSLDLGNERAAQQYNEEAMNLRKQPDEPIRLWPLINQARIHQMRNELTEAETYLRQVVESGVNDPAPRLDASERLAGLLASQGRNAEADAQFRSALALIDDRRTKLSRDHSKLSYFSSVIRLHQRYVDFLYNRNRTNEALLAAESSRAKLLSQRLHPNGPVRLPVSIERLQGLAKSSGAYLLSYWLGPEGSLMWLVTPSKVHPFALPSEREIRKLVQSHTRSIIDLNDSLDDPDSAGRRLYDMIAAPVESLLPAAVRVVIVPDGSLHDLNFETLVSSRGKPHYWMEDLTITVVPSLEVLFDSKPSAPRSPSLLLIGNPTSADPAKFRPLKNAGPEIEYIKKLFAGNEIVTRTGAAARPSAYRETKPARFTMIHFAAHAVADRESPLDSAVILAPGEGGYKLYARDIIRESIQPELVTISACRSAGARTYGGEGLVGFAWAFLDAGARGVVAGLWEVDDESTSALMQRMYDGIHKGQRPVDALRSAKLTLLHSPGSSRKPYYWAPFQMFAASL